MVWFIPAMMSHDVLQGESEGMVWPAFQRGPTPWAVATAQIIHDNIPKPHHMHTTRNGILNFSGRSHKNGVDRNQNTTNPTNWSVVAGKLGLKVFGMRAYEGQIAVKHTATRRPPFQPDLGQHPDTKLTLIVSLLTLDGVPNEVK